MTVQQLIDELNAYGLDRKVEINVGGGYVPTGITWDGDRRCLAIEVEESPILQEPYRYEGENECPDCGHLLEDDETCSCGE